MLCPNCIPWRPSKLKSWQCGCWSPRVTLIPVAENQQWETFLCKPKGAQAAWEGEQKTCPAPCLPLPWVLTLHSDPAGDPVSHPAHQPSWLSHQADLQPLLWCVCEGEGNWAVVNLMFLSNQVILCSWSLKGNSCFLAPLLRGHLPLCLLQLLGNRSLRRVTALQHFSTCCGGGRGSTKRAFC